MTTLTGPTETLAHLVLDRARDGGDEIALLADGGAALTRREWAERSGSVARGLAHQGVRPGDPVALVYPAGDWIGFAVADLAVRLAGATVVAMSTRLGPEEIGRRIAYCGVVGVLHGAGVDLPAETGRAGVWASTTARLARTGPSGVTAVPSDGLAEIIYTSGSTGDAKPVAVSHANLLHGRGSARGALFSRGTGVLTAVPIGTNAAHSALMLALTGGNPVRVTADDSPDAIARTVAETGTGWVILPPTVATAWAAGAVTDRYDLSCVGSVMLGAAPVPAATVHRLAMLLPAAGIVIGYGSTEAAPAFCHLPLDPSAGRADPRFHERPRAAPLGLPGGDGEVKIAGPDGDPVPPGEVGEICLRGPAPQRRYHRDDAANARVFRAGWTHMGDLGRLDADGQLHFFDRAADVITTGGRRVSSLHVAGALMWHPEVVDAAAVAVPHPELGEVIGAAVQLRSPVPDDRLQAFLADRLEPHEVPTHIRRFDALPRGLTGKHGKGRLRARFAAAS